MIHTAHDPAETDLSTVIGVIAEKIAPKVKSDWKRVEEAHQLNIGLIASTLKEGLLKHFDFDSTKGSLDEDRVRRARDLDSLIDSHARIIESDLIRVGAIPFTELNQAELKEEVFSQLSEDEVGALSRLCDVIGERVSDQVRESYSITPKSLFELLAHQVTNDYEVSLRSLVNFGASWVRSANAPHSE